MTDAQMVIVRGLPGSGKSTLAREIAKSCGYYHLENDMYFETEGGYFYDRSQIAAAQQWCFKTARDLILRGEKVVISNLFTKIHHMNSFLQLTDSFLVIECTGEFGSIHEIPTDIIDRTRSEWETYSGAVRI